VSYALVAEAHQTVRQQMVEVALVFGIETISQSFLEIRIQFWLATLLTDLNREQLEERRHLTVQQFPLLAEAAEMAVLVRP